MICKKCELSRFKKQKHKGMKVLLTGGGGFLGSHIIKLFLEASEGKHDNLAILRGASLRVLDVIERIRRVDDEDLLRDVDSKVEWIVGSVVDYQVVYDALKGCDGVLHCGSVIDFGNTPRELVMNVNVHGTENIVRACEELGVKALVYTSSLDVLIGRGGVDGGNEENTPYVMDSDPKSLTPYSRSKTLAEKLVLDDARKVLACSIRPVGMYGEGDPFHTGEALTMARKAGMFNLFRIGDGSSVFQHAYAGNVAYMELCALARLFEGDEKVVGQAFMGIDDTKVNNFFEFLEPYFAHQGYKVPRISVPINMAYAVAFLGEHTKKVFGTCFPSLKRMKLNLTFQSVFAIATTQWFDTKKPHELLQYEPLFTPMEARSRTFAYYDKCIDEFPKGKYRYRENEYNFFDDGKNFRPDKKKHKRVLDDSKTD